MAGKFGAGNPVAVSDLATGILDPLMRKRAGISIDLVQSWEEIVGETLASRTRPERISWPRRHDEDDPFEPATLVVACEGTMALRLQHQTAEVIGRANAFLGFAAIGRIRIVQKPVRQAGPPPKPSLRPLTDGETARVASAVAPIEDGALREALERLGRSVLASRKAK